MDDNISWFTNYKLAKQMNISILKQAWMDIFFYPSKVLVPYEQIKALGLDQININDLFLILKQSRYKVVDNRLVHKVIISWISCNESERIKYLDDLFKYVNFKMFDDSYLYAQVFNNEMVTKHSQNIWKIKEASDSASLLLIGGPPLYNMGTFLNLILW